MAGHGGVERLQLGGSVGRLFDGRTWRRKWWVAVYRQTGDGVQPRGIVAGHGSQAGVLAVCSRLAGGMAGCGGQAGGSAGRDGQAGKMAGLGDSAGAMAGCDE